MVTFPAFLIRFFGQERRAINIRAAKVRRSLLEQLERDARNWRMDYEEDNEESGCEFTADDSESMQIFDGPEQKGWDRYSKREEEVNQRINVKPLHWKGNSAMNHTIDREHLLRRISKCLRSGEEGLNLYQRELTSEGQSKSNEEISIKIWRWLTKILKYTVNVDFFLRADLREHLPVRRDSLNRYNDNEGQQAQQEQRYDEVDRRMWTFGTLVISISSISCLTGPTKITLISLSARSDRVVVLIWESA